MPGFCDNLRRARQAAGLSPEDLASRVGAAPVWLAHLEAIGASLPELPDLVRLAEALGCPIDELLAGDDTEFDHPRRRHAALIAARLGRISVLLSRLNAARARQEFSARDERDIDEPALLASVYRCRGWVTSPDAELSIAATLERELDDHFTRIRQVCDRVAGSALAVSGPAGSAAPRALVSPHHEHATAAAGRTMAVAPPPSGGAPQTTGSSASPAPCGSPTSGPPKPVPSTKMWSRPGPGQDEYVCQMSTSGGKVVVQLACGERVLATQACKNLDEAFAISGTWKRLPDPEMHFAQSFA
jgi:transcriptional regulator with XRE-family HTH domain